MASRNETIRGSVDPILSKLAIGFKHENLIARQVAPVVESLSESGTLYTFGKEGFMLYDTERALRANAKKINFAISSDTYICKEHALESSLDYKEIDLAEKAGANQLVKLQKRALMLTDRALSIELEKAVADVVLSGTYYASGNKVTLTGSDQWSDDNSDILGQIETGLAAARADMGIEPNTLVLGYDAYREMAGHPQIKAMVSDNKDKAIVLKADDLAALLRFDRVLVGKARYTTDAGVFTDIWTDSAALIYTPAPGEMAEGTTPHTVIIEEVGYPEVKTYPMKKVIDYETTLKYQVKNLSTSYGYLITDCKA